MTEGLRGPAECAPQAAGSNSVVRAMAAIMSSSSPHRMPVTSSRISSGAASQGTPVVALPAAATSIFTRPKGSSCCFRASVTSSSTGRGMVSIRRPASASPHGRGASHIGPHRGAFGQLEDHPLDPAIVDCGAEDHGGPNSTIRIQCPPYAQRRAYPARLNVRQTRQARLRTCPQIAAYAVAWWLEPHHCKWR